MTNVRRALKLASVFAIVAMAGLACRSPLSASQSAPPNAIEKESFEKWGGKKAEGFALPSTDDKTIDVAKEIGKKPIVLVFYRGNW